MDDDARTPTGLSREELGVYLRREMDRIEIDFRTRPVTGWVPSLVLVSDTFCQGRRHLSLFMIPNPPRDMQAFIESYAEHLAREGQRAAAVLFSATAWAVEHDPGEIEMHPAEHPLRQETLFLIASTPVGDTMMATWPILRKGDTMFLQDPRVGNTWQGSPRPHAALLAAFWRGYCRAVAPD